MEENIYNSLLYGFLRNPVPTILWFESFLNNSKFVLFLFLLIKKKQRAKLQMDVGSVTPSIIPWRYDLVC